MYFYLLVPLSKEIAVSVLLAGKSVRSASGARSGGEDPVLD